MRSKRISKMQLQFDLRAVDEAVMVVADERRLRQVLVNLLSNAIIEYNRQGGLVALWRGGSFAASAYLG